MKLDLDAGTREGRRRIKTPFPTLSSSNATVPADVLADHVVFEVECIDRMYCNVYVPKLQFAAGLLGYVQRQLGLPIASTAPLGKITDAFSAFG